MTANVMLCVCNRVSDNASLINAHRPIYPTSCVETRPLPQTNCECQNPTTCSQQSALLDPSLATIRIPTYVTEGTYHCDENKSRLMSNSASLFISNQLT